MAWQIEFTPDADKLLGKLDHQNRKRISRYIRKTIASLENPRTRGEAMSANYAGYWRYRIGDYRVICEIKDEKVIVLVVKLGHRRQIYE